MIFDMFKSKAEKEQEKADKEVSRLVKEAADSEKIHDATLKREAAEKARKAQANLDYKRQVRKAEAALKDMEDTVTASLVLALDKLQTENAKTYPNPTDVKKYRQRLKNYFFELLTVKRAQETLEDCKINHQWEETMNTLSNTFKLMNQVKSRSSAVKKILFFYRYSQVKKTDTAVFKQIEDYFGSDTDEKISAERMKEFESIDPIDLMVSDKLFELLNDPSRVGECMENPEVTTMNPDEAANVVKDTNRSAVEVGAQPPVEGIDDHSASSEEELQNMSSML